MVENADTSAAEDILKIVGLASKLSAVMRKEVSRKVRRAGLKSVDFIVLKTLSSEPTTQNRLADRLGLTKPAITYTVDRLEAKGLVRRRRTTHDRRNVAVELTKKGRRMLQRAEHLYLQSLQKRLSTLSQQDLATLQHTLERLLEIFQEDPDPQKIDVYT